MAKFLVTFHRGDMAQDPESVSRARHTLVEWAAMTAARYPHDAGLATLLADLRAGSDEFSVIWDTYPVRVPGHRTKNMVHPEVGRLQVSCDVLTVPDDDQQVVFITADPASRSARALRHLTCTLPAKRGSAR